MRLGDRLLTSDLRRFPSRQPSDAVPRTHVIGFGVLPNILQNNAGPFSDFDIRFSSELCKPLDALQQQNIQDGI